MELAFPHSPSDTNTSGNYHQVDSSNSQKAKMVD